MTKEQLTEESLINLAYAILNEKRASVSFNDLLKLIQELVGYSDAEMKSRLLQFYTDINIDGRFLYNQEAGWGLREWFKVEETAPSVKTQKKKSKAAFDDEDLDEDVDLEEEDIDFDEDFEEFVDEEDIEEEDDEKEEIDFDDEEIEEIDEEIDEDFIDEEEEEFDEEEEEN